MPSACVSARVCLSKRTRNHVYIIQNTKTIIEIAFWNGVCRRRKRPFSLPLSLIFTLWTHRTNAPASSLYRNAHFLLKRILVYSVRKFICRFCVDSEYKLSLFVFYYCREYFEFCSQVFQQKKHPHTPPPPTLRTCLQSNGKQRKITWNECLLSQHFDTQKIIYIIICIFVFETKGSSPFQCAFKCKWRTVCKVSELYIVTLNFASTMMAGWTKPS